MGSPFDSIQATVFETAKSVFGFECSWVSADSGATYVGKCLFKNPTEAMQIAGVVWDHRNWMMEYKQGDFEGLKDRVDQRNTKEVVTIDGQNYMVMAVNSAFDGKTYRAALEPIE